MAQGEIHVTLELLLDLFKDGEHGFAITNGVPVDATVNGLNMNKKTGEVVLSFDCPNEVAAVVVPEVTRVDVPALLDQNEALREQIKLRGLGPADPPVVPSFTPQPQEHGSLNPTDGRTGKTTPVGQ